MADPIDLVASAVESMRKAAETAVAMQKAASERQRQLEKTLADMMKSKQAELERQLKLYQDTYNSLGDSK